MKTLLPLAIACLLLSVIASCTIGTPPAGEGEGEGEGDVGEGEGEGDLQPIDVGPPPQGFDTTPPAGFGNAACSTGQFWVLGDRGSDNMHPGADCMSCHAQRGGPNLALGGTVMGRTNDGEDCRGIPGVTVDIIGNDGSVVLSEDTSAAGNLYASGDLSSVAPYTIRLTYQGRTTQMVTPQTDGNCMHCHTPEGLNGAPGRIVAP